MNPLSQAATGVVAAGTGATAGIAAVQAIGLTALGVLGPGFGWGAAAGPVGAVVGGVTGLAVFGVAITVDAVRREPVVQRTAERAQEFTRRTTRRGRQRFGRWIAGDEEHEDTGPA